MASNYGKPYTISEIKDRLVSSTYQYDTPLKKRGKDPEHLRKNFFEFCNERGNVSLYDSAVSEDGKSIIHTVDGKKYEYDDFPESVPNISFTEGITLKYNTEIDKKWGVFVINYNPNLICGFLPNGTEVGTFSGSIHEVASYWDEWGCTKKEFYWTDHIYTVNLVDIFNSHPSIIKDLCNNDKIGILAVVKYIKLIE
jgi:hypothetical protein